MTDWIVIGAWLLVITGFGIGGIFGILGLYRKWKGWVIEVKKDYRNPDKRPQKFYAMVDKPDNSIRYYSSSMNPWQTRKVPLYDLSAWADSARHITVVRGVTGKPGDDMDVPIGLSLNSQAACNDYAKLMSDSITHILPFYDKCKEIDLRVGEIGAITVKRNGVNTKLAGTITRIDYRGAVFEYDTGKKDRKDEPIMKTIMLDHDNINEFKTMMDKEEKQRLSPLGYSNFFTTMFVMQKMGVRKVEDANVMTIPAKQSIANFINGNNEFVNEGLGLFEKHFFKFFALGFFLILALSVYFVINGNLQWNSGVTAQLIATHDAVCGGTAPSASSLQGTTTTTINPVTALQNRGNTNPVNVGGANNNG